MRCGRLLPRLGIRRSHPPRRLGRSSVSRRRPRQQSARPFRGPRGEDDILHLGRARKGRLSLLVEHLSDPSRSLRHARGAAVSVSAPRERHSRAPDLDRACSQLQLAERWRRVLSVAAVSPLPLRRPAHQRARRQAGGVLLPPVEGGRRAAAAKKRWAQEPVPSLPQLEPHGRASPSFAVVLSLGAHGPRFSRQRGAVQGERVGAVASPVLRLSRLDASDAARWDRFVDDCPEATFFHRSGWKRILEDVFRHEAFFFLAVSEDGIEGVLPLGRVRSRLFGDALISVPFGVYGGVAVHDESVRRLLEDEAERLAVVPRCCSGTRRRGEGEGRVRHR